MSVTLLQAALLAGWLLLYVGLPVFLLITLPKLIGLVMRFIWKKQNKKSFIENNIPYYKDPLIYIPVLALCLVVLSCLYYFTMMLLMSSMGSL
jgi:hypothetical protein